MDDGTRVCSLVLVTWTRIAGNAEVVRNSQVAFCPAVIALGVQESSIEAFSSDWGSDANGIAMDRGSFDVVVFVGGHDRRLPGPQPPAEMENVLPPEILPPGAGLNTVTWPVPTLAMSAAEITVIKRLLLT